MRVFVRMRPMRQGEGESTIRLEDESGKRLWLQGERLTGSSADQPAAVGGLLQFDFDGILHADIAQQSVYEAVARPLVDGDDRHAVGVPHVLRPDRYWQDVHVWRRRALRVTERKPPSAVERVSPRLEDARIRAGAPRGSSSSRPTPS